ncbi:MAG: hypothetical protein CM15mP65_17210 [Crocinitomicaceae bacterium]|nr:MAG: hypothetical protein CM15mP65_17210 [Crocinitomicaceae bacterium]
MKLQQKVFLEEESRPFYCEEKENSQILTESNTDYVAPTPSPELEKNDGKIRFLLENDEVEDEVDDKETELKVDQKLEEAKSFQSQEENKLNEAKEIIDERLERIKKATQKLRSPLGLNEMENVPAYKRRNIELDDVNPSSESEVSKYTLWESEDDNGEKRTGLSDNNSFLHDNVD